MKSIVDTDLVISTEYLRSHPDVIFVFGDNTLHVGRGGAAYFRYEPNTYGFITKKYPNLHFGSYYTTKEYEEVYDQEIKKLIKHMQSNPGGIYVIAKIGSNLANLHGIFEAIIQPRMKIDLWEFNHQIIWLW